MGREPQRQNWLAYGLLVALAIVVFGSMLGEYAGIKGWIQQGWQWFGDQGFEYLDLGRFWQVLLIIALFFWTVILFRGLRGRLSAEHMGNMPWLFFFSALSIPAFYAVGLLAHPASHFTTTDFWRFWVVHLWVEDFLELFTTIMVAYIFVLLGVVNERVALTVIYRGASYCDGASRHSGNAVRFPATGRQIGAVGEYSPAKGFPWRRNYLTLETPEIPSHGMRELPEGDKLQTHRRVS